MQEAARQDEVLEALAMPVEGNDWEQWKARVWNALVARFGYPGLAPLEQWIVRSYKERRCVECGAPGTHQHESVLVKVVPHYWMCDDCHKYWEEK